MHKLVNLKLLINNQKFRNIILSTLIIFITLNQNPDLKWQETKQSVVQIKKTLETNNCKEANDILSQYEIWIVKNIFPNLCNSRYDFEKKINILF